MSKNNLSFLTFLLLTCFVYLGIVTPTAVHAATCDSTHVRYASSSNTLYVENGGICTLTNISSLASSSAPLVLEDSSQKVWFLGANLKVEDGSTLVLNDDVNMLKIKSNAGDYVSMIIDYGKLESNGTTITSWDLSSGQPDMDSSNGRSYISIISRAGGQNSQLAIHNSQMQYLGFNGSTDKSGFAMKTINPDGSTTISGSVSGSTFSHNYIGSYLWGANSMNWSSNTFTQNETDGLALNNGTGQNTFTSNTFADNSNYGLYVSDANNNNFTGNTFNGNTENYYYAKQNAQNTITDTTSIQAKANTSTASWTIKSTQRLAYMNDRNIATTVDGLESSLVLESSNTSSVVTFTRVALQSIPQTGTLAITPRIWEMSGNHYKKWTVETATTTDVSFTVGELKPNTNYDIRIDGNDYQQKTSNGTGEITFSYAQNPAGKSFEVLPASATFNPICSSENVRWASSSNSLYLSGQVTCTLTDLLSIIGTSGPLSEVTTGEWLLTANLRLTEGAKLKLYGRSIGGDVDYLKLKSENNTNPNNYIFIRADHGTLDIRSTKITSWNTASNSVDTETDTYGRAFIHVRSRLADDGVTAHESTMDILNSEIAYLGHYAAESYGLVWKVSGTPTQSLFDAVNVYGDIKNSYIHHNYFGVYTYGLYGGEWTDNEIAYNIQYGLDPHDDSDSILMENNHSHHNGNHGIICSQRCDTLTIRNNRSEYNTGVGIMLHRNANDSVVENNQVNHNTDAGIAIFDSHNNLIRNNNAQFNKYGIRFSVGSSGNTTEGNVFSDNSSYGMFFYKGSDAPTSGDGRPKNNTFTNNEIDRNWQFGMKLKEADNNTFDGNQLIDNYKAVTVYFNNPTGNVFTNNIFSGSGGYALKLESTSDTEVIGNTFTGNKYAVQVFGGSNHTISQNQITASTYQGVRLENTTGITFDGNTVENNPTGLAVLTSSGNAITNNAFNNNTKYGIHLVSSPNNTLSGNTFSGNGTNIYQQ